MVRVTDGADVGKDYARQLEIVFFCRNPKHKLSAAIFIDCFEGSFSILRYELF